MKRTPRKLRYPIKRSLKMREETFEKLLFIAGKKDMKYSTLLRKIVEQWIWGYMSGPGKKSISKAKNERLL